MHLKKVWIFTLKRQSRLHQTTNLATFFLISEKKGMIYLENRLPADDSREISYLLCYLRKGGKIWNCRLLQIIDGALRVKLFFKSYFTLYILEVLLKRVHWQTMNIQMNAAWCCILQGSTLFAKIKTTFRGDILLNEENSTCYPFKYTMDRPIPNAPYEWENPSLKYMKLLWAMAKTPSNNSELTLLIPIPVERTYFQFYGCWISFFRVL